MLRELKWKPSTKVAKVDKIVDGETITVDKIGDDGKKVREIAAYNLLAVVEDEDGNQKALNLATTVNRMDRTAEDCKLFYGFDDPIAGTLSERADNIHQGMQAKAKEYAKQLKATVKFAASRTTKERKETTLDAGALEFAE